MGAEKNGVYLLICDVGLPPCTFVIVRAAFGATLGGADGEGRGAMREPGIQGVGGLGRGGHLAWMPGEGQQQLPGKPGAAGLAESRGEWSESQAGLAGHGAPGQAPQRIRASHRDLRRRERRVLPACSWCGVHLEADGAPRRPINASHAPPPNGQSATCLRHHREVGSTPRRGVSVDDQVVRCVASHALLQHSTRPLRLFLIPNDLTSLTYAHVHTCVPCARRRPKEPAYNS